jgi:hypothetical protein
MLNLPNGIQSWVRCCEGRSCWHQETESDSVFVPPDIPFRCCVPGALGAVSLGRGTTGALMDAATDERVGVSRLFHFHGMFH